jgi:MFS family permease
MLRVAWIGIAVVPALWLVSSSYPYLLALQLVSGTAWAAHEYASFLLLFETIRTERRVAILTAYNLAHAVALVGGSLLGGWLLEGFGPGRPGYVAIFTISTSLRAVAVLLLARVHDGVRPLELPSFRTVAVNPAVGLVLRPILATFRRRDADPDIE